MGYTAEDFTRMENLKKKYPEGIQCDRCEHYNDCPYPKTTDRLTRHNCCDFKDSRLDLKERAEK